MKTKDLYHTPPSGGRQGDTTDSRPTRQIGPEGEPEGRPDASPTTPPGDPPTAAEVVVPDPQTISSTSGTSGRTRSNQNLLRGDREMRRAKAAKEQRLATKLIKAGKKVRRGLMSESELGELISDLLRDPEMPPHTMPALVTSLQKLPMYQQTAEPSQPKIPKDTRAWILESLGCICGIRCPQHYTTPTLDEEEAESQSAMVLQVGLAVARLRCIGPDEDSSEEVTQAEHEEALRDEQGAMRKERYDQ